MNKEEKQEVLDVLNSLEVVESNGGGESYILVENSEYNQELLRDVGIEKETIDKYGDDETFCVMALAFGEGYCDLCVSEGKLILFDKSFEVIVGCSSVIVYKQKDNFHLVISETNGEISQVKLTHKQVEELRSTIA